METNPARSPALGSTRRSKPLPLGRQPSLRRGVGLALALSAVQAVGATEGSERPRARDWSLTGSVRLGAVATWTNSNLDPQHRPATRDPATDDEYDAGLDLYPLLDLRLRAPRGVSMYLTTPSDEYGVATGVTVPTTWGKVDIQACYVFSDSVWNDPYLLGLPREETDRERFGGTVALKDIGGTRWSTSYTLRRVDVEEDRAGHAHPELQRSGLTHRIELATSFDLGGGQLSGAAEYERADLDGDAAAYDAATVTVAWTVPWRRYLITLGAEVGYDTHRASHPLFGSTRDDLRLGGNALVTYREPFGITGAELGALSAWSNEDSNCDFYDAQSFHLGMFIGYHF